MSQLTARTAQPNLQLVPRVREFEHEALDQLFERTFAATYGLLQALSGDHLEAERVVAQVYRRVIDSVSQFEGTGLELERWPLRLASESRPRVNPEGPGGSTRQAFARLGSGQREALGLRLLAGLDGPAVAATLAKRPALIQVSELNGLRVLAGREGTSLPLPGQAREVDAALDRLQAGEPVEAVAPSFSGARELLEAAAAILSIPREEAPAAARDRARTEFLATAEERRALWVHRHHVPAEVPWARPQRPKLNIGEGAALILIGILAIGIGTVLAILTSLSDPASPFGLYGLKRAGESALLVATRDNAKRADLDLKLSQTRRKEAETMAASGHPDLAVQATRDHFTILKAGAERLAAAPGHQRASWIKVRDDYAVEESVPMAPIENQLISQGFKAQAAEVKALNEQFQSLRKELDLPLGKPSTASPTQPGPSSAPSATPPQ